MKRLLIVILIVAPLGAVGLYFFNQYWIHRYDALIAQQAAIYRLDPDLVWSIIYEETYFRPWKIGGEGEIGLMQVTPTVGREWAAEVRNSMPELQRQMQRDPESILRDPKTNIAVGCWYLEKLSESYRDADGWEARMIAGYNAGKSRADNWNQTDENAPPLTVEQFIQRIDIPSTRAYVSSILARYRRLKEERARNGNTQSRNTQSSNTQTGNAQTNGQQLNYQQTGDTSESGR